MPGALVKPAPFEYHRVRTVEQAVRLLAELGEDAKLLAGGQSLVPMMSFRLARPSHLVDIAGIESLRYVEVSDVLEIGALTTHHTVETYDGPGFHPRWSVLSRAMDFVGHLPIRTRGTVGGSLAHADAVGEWCLLAVLLDATVVCTGPSGSREVPAADFFHGFFSTALRPAEMVTALRIPAAAPRAALVEHALRRGDFAVVAAAVNLQLDGPMITSARVVVAGVAPTPLTLPAVDEALVGLSVQELPALTRAADAARDLVDPPDDHQGSSAFRRDVMVGLIARACRQAAA